MKTAEGDPEPTCEFTKEPHGGGEKFECGGPSYQAMPNPAGWGIENSHFITWMRLAPLKDFSKLRYRIDQNVVKGDELIIEYKNIFDVNTFKGKKGLAIMKPFFLGGANGIFFGGFLALAIVLLVHGCIYLRFGQKPPASMLSMVPIQDDPTESPEAPIAADS